MEKKESATSDFHLRKWRLYGPALGHLWTILPSLRRTPHQSSSCVAQSFSTTVEDAVAGQVQLSGLYLDCCQSDDLVVLIHGLGGSAMSAYIQEAAYAIVRSGRSALCLSMRGADGSGEDIFHGGLTDDIRAALAAPVLARYWRVQLLGFSVGGHLALKAALDGVDPRLTAVAAICSPLDLDQATIAFDHPAAYFYRRYIFAALNRLYDRAAARRKFLTPARVVRKARYCRERDAVTVVPRFGFRNPEDYYHRESVASRIHQLATPALLVAASYDPIIPARTLRPSIANASHALSVRWVDHGGHVGFPVHLDLGFGGPLGLARQVLQWFARV